MVHCRPKEPHVLWEKYKKDFAEDYVRRLGEVEGLLVAYRKIADHLAEIGKPISEFPTMPTILQAEWSLETIEQAVEAHEGQALYVRLTDAQRAIVDRVLAELLQFDPTKAKCFYISGHAGTGKSFTYR